MKYISLLCAMFMATSTWGLSVLSFNLQFYGKGGTALGYVKKEVDGSKTGYDEYRDYHLKSFINSELPQADIIFLQEVVLKDRIFEKEILSDQIYNCHSYDSNMYTHQFVVACVKKTLSYEIEVLYDVQGNQNGQRPAVVVKLQDPSTKKVKAYVTGLHLNYPNYNDDGSRDSDEKNFTYQQLATLGDWMNKHKDAPHILAGDFNIGLKSLIVSKLRLESDNQVEAVNPKQGTLLSGRQYDYIFASKSLTTQPITSKTYDTCNNYNWQYSDSRYLNYSFYKRYISDHCPTWADISAL